MTGEKLMNYIVNYPMYIVEVGDSVTINTVDDDLPGQLAGGGCWLETGADFTLRTGVTAYSESCSGTNGDTEVTAIDPDAIYLIDDEGMKKPFVGLGKTVRDVLFNLAELVYASSYFINEGDEYGDPYYHVIPVEKFEQDFPGEPVNRTDRFTGNGLLYF